MEAGGTAGQGSHRAVEPEEEELCRLFLYKTIWCEINALNTNKERDVILCEEKVEPTLYKMLN